MTYAEIKNQYTSIESINSRLDEINKFYSEQDDKADELNASWFDKIKKFFNDNLNSDYQLYSLTPSNLTLSCPGDTFYRIDFYYGYDVKDWNTMEQVWKFEMNIASCGNFSINDAKDEDQKKIFNYYNTIAMILSNEELRRNIEKIVKEYVDVLKEIRNENGKVRSEEKQLEILKNNMHKEEVESGYYEEAKNATDRTQLVIIDKKANPADCKATHRGTPVTFHSSLMPNEAYPEACKKCKEMNKMNKNARYIATEVRYIKFN